MKLSPINKSIYTTLITEDAAVGDRFILRKATAKDLCDDEAIGATLILSGLDDQKSSKKDVEAALTLADDFCYVANSVKTVARGTYSAGRLYDQFEKYLVVAVEFTPLCGFATFAKSSAKSTRKPTSPSSQTWNIPTSGRFVLGLTIGLTKASTSTIHQSMLSTNN